MDARITLSFRADIIEKAKEYAENQGISLSRLTEVLLSRLVQGGYQNIEDFPVSDWVNQLSEGESHYLRKPRSRKETKKSFYESRK